MPYALPEVIFRAKTNRWCVMGRLDFGWMVDSAETTNRIPSN
jgi:hypothetical protein